MQPLKLTLTCSALLLSSILPLSAQNGGVRIDTSRTVIRDANGNIIGGTFEIWMEGSFESRKERLKSQKVAFFSNNINFTAKEAEKFWPVYNEYYEKREILTVERDKTLRQLANFENMVNDKEVKALLDAYTSSFTKESELFQEYYKKFSAILSPKKVIRLYITEEQFKQMLLRTLRSR
jgi:hypothetical protein